MYRCPRCHDSRLVRTSNSQGRFFECPDCRGRAVALAVLRRVVDQDAIKQVWIDANRAKTKGDSGAARRLESNDYGGSSSLLAIGGVNCPVCSREMAEVGIPRSQPLLHIDVCRTCQFVWFDPHELEELPTKSHHAEEKPPSPAVRELLAQSERRVLEARRQADAFGNEAPDEAWKWLPAMFGLPVEHEVNELGSRPWATWAVALILALVALATFSDVHQFALEYGFIPARPFRLGGATLVTAFLLHAGFGHLLGNSYFLLVFGDNVEDHLGPKRFLILLAAATLGGHLLHAACDPRSGIPCIGASGGISGVIVFYALQFPHARLGLIWRVAYYMRWARFPAWCAVLFWLAIQTLYAYLQLSGLSNVSAMAHFGGAATGFGAWMLWRDGAFRNPQLAERTEFQEITDTFARIRQAKQES
ncbi:MAG: rhomboid family intramembrane serine protease [Planctomycetaceae bacterium]|nr:rhomboid family intramembrane serine protease [Planctomycetales bacterium]MCB9923677.1 rhomboid family intramembrane serine protease [Planctomycetaceae bacterium]